MPLYRRIPKRGFKNPFRTEYAVVNLSDLARCFPGGGTVTPEGLVEAGAIKAGVRHLVKVLADGNLQPGLALTVHAHAFSKAAVEKIQAAGGRTEVIQA